MVFALETYCAATDGRSAARIEEEVVVTATGCDVITRFPAEELLVAGRHVRARRRTSCAATGEPQSATAPSPRASPPRWRRPRSSSLRTSPGDGRDRHAGARGRAARIPPRPARGRCARRCSAGALERAHDVPPRRRHPRLDPHGAGSVSLAAGHVDEHLHSFETSFYVLEGEPVLYLEGRGVRLRPAACGAIPVGSPHAFRCDERALWIEMASPRPRIDGSDTFFLDPAPETEADPLDARDPRNHNLFLLTEGEMDIDTLKHGQAMGAPAVSGSMATAVLAYSGIAVKMLVDQRLDAQLHTMFMVDYQPRACANPHDHPFEESYYMLEGEVDVVANGDRHTLRPGDAFWTGTGMRPRLLRDAGRAGALARDVRPRPATASLLPSRAGLGLPRRPPGLRTRAPPHEPRRRHGRRGARRGRRHVRGAVPADASHPRLRGPRAEPLPSRRGLRDDAPLLRAGGGRGRLRVLARAGRPRGVHVSAATGTSSRWEPTPRACSRSCSGARPASTAVSRGR